MLVAIVGEGWCFVLNAASFVGVILCLTGMRLPMPARRLKSGSPGRALIDGLNFVRRTPPFPALFINLATISILGLSYATLMPVMARDVLASGPKAMGMLMGSSGLGALVASLNLAARKGPIGLETWPTRYAIGLGLLLALFAASRDLFVSTLIQAPIGYCFLSAVASTNTLLQSHVPDHLRGRVMSVHAFCLLGLAPFGALASGTLAHLIGAPLTIAAGGIGLSAICLIVDRSRAIANYPAPINKPASR
jgi:hypothetical protein